MNALQSWNGGVILISHDERFITTVSNEVTTCLDTIDPILTICLLPAVGMWRRSGNEIQGRRTSLQGIIFVVPAVRISLTAFLQSLIVSNLKQRP